MASFSNFKSTIVTAANDAAGVTSGVTIYATRNSLPTSGNSQGDQAYVTGNNRLYIWNGSGWYNVALLNVAPTISSVTDSDGGTTPFALSTTGAVTTITITAADSDGDPITYTASADSNFSGLATLSQAANVFTITPLSQDSATTELGTITFTATDGINVASSGVQTFTLYFISPYWDETVLSVGTSSTNSLDNDTFIDRSGNNRGVTVLSGTPHQSAFHPYLDNWSVEFVDATDDYITFPDNTDWDFVNSGDFTVDFWMNSKTTSNICTLGQSGGAGSRPDKWGLYINDTTVGLTAGTIGWHLGSNGNIQGPSITINAGRWYHIQVSRSGDTWYFFQDGTLLGTASSTIRPSVVANTLRVGSDGESYRDFSGYLSNFRIVKGTNLNTSSFTSPTENLTAITNTVLLTCQSNRFIDNSTNGYTPTIVGHTGHVKISALNPFGQVFEYAPGANKGSVYFDGASDYLDVDASTDIGTGDFTIQGWIYDERAVTNERQIISNRGDGGGLYLGLTSASELYPYIGGSYATSGAGIQANAWQHFAICRTSGTMETYVNGVRYRSDNQGSDFFGSTGWTIGGGDVGQFKGWIADLRVATVADYTGASYTIPTSPTGSTNADLYLTGDNAGIYDKTGNNTLTLNGNTATSTTQTKFATTSMYFDGTGDSIVIEDNNLFDFGSADFTIEGWFYQNATSNMGLFGKRETNTQYGTINLDVFSGNIRFLISTNNGSWTSTSATSFAPTINTWYHLALVRDTSASTLTLYANGTNVGQLTSFTASIVDTAYPFIIGNSVENFTESPFNGHIENFQVLKGIAKYTANFTPPILTQGRTYQAES